MCSFRFQGTSTDSTRTYFVCLSAGDSPRNLITFFSETMWTGGSSLQKPFVSFWLTRSNIRKTSFFYAGITNAQASMFFTDSTMNVSMISHTFCERSIYKRLIIIQYNNRYVMVIMRGSRRGGQEFQTPAPRKIQIPYIYIYIIWLFFCTGKRRFSFKLWKTFTDCFNCLPIAAVIEEKIFCCHGGQFKG